MAAAIDDLDPGIRQVVAWMQLHGFRTTDSGDGVSKVGSGMEGVLDVPHVHAVVSPEKMISEADRLARLLQAEGVDINDAAFVQATYDPGNRIAVVSLFRVDDALLNGGGA